jgi:hypothetical protein
MPWQGLESALRTAASCCLSFSCMSRDTSLLLAIRGGVKGWFDDNEALYYGVWQRTVTDSLTACCISMCRAVSHANLSKATWLPRGTTRSGDLWVCVCSLLCLSQVLWI